MRQGKSHMNFVGFDICIPGRRALTKAGKKTTIKSNFSLYKEVFPMPAVWINMLLVLCGSVLGLSLKSRFSPRAGQAVMKCLGLCVLGIGLSSLLAGEDTLCLIICMVIGTLLGEWIDIEGKMDALGELLKRKFMKDRGDNRFVEGFVTATVVYCVGAMAINGSLAAGLNQDYSVIISKGVIDGVSAITFSAAMGVGVAFSVIPILLYQGGLTLLAGAVGPYLPDAVVVEMSAVGGAIIVGIAFNLLDLPREKLKVGNMLPAVFLPIAYLPLAQRLAGLLG